MNEHLHVLCYSHKPDSLSYPPVYILKPGSLSRKRTAVPVRFPVQQTEISISYGWGIIDLRYVLSMVLPSSGSQLNYAVCCYGNNPIFVQSVTGWSLHRSLVSCVFLGLPARLHIKDIVFVSSARETKVQVKGRVFRGFAGCSCVAVC
jgi:hypothetical protein